MPGSLSIRVLALALALLPGRASAQPHQQANDTGAISVSATVSGFVDITAGGPAALAGSAGGSILNNKSKGAILTGLTINLGELGPVNTNDFVVVTVPLRLRSNAGYSLTMSATQLPAGDPNALVSSDVGFGLDSVSRADTNVMAGSDSPTAGTLGDPSLGPDANPATPRWDYPPKKRLSDYAVSSSVLGGSRIMKPVPATLIDGLVFNTFFCVKPQFYTPAVFTITVTYTISTP